MTDQKFTLDEIAASWLGEGAYVEATTVKELKADVLKLKESAESWKAADREKFDEIATLKGYLKDAVNALESMPGEVEEWHKYARWAESLRNQTVERIKRELSI